MTDFRPLEESFTLPSHYYYDARAADQELETLFPTYFDYVGHLNELAEPGSYIKTDLGNELIILVNDNGKIRGFLDVCKHRGGPLCVRKGTQTSVIQCQYHGWTYRMNGELRGVPEFQHARLFDKSEFGLEELSVIIWHSFIFASVTGENQASFQSVLNEIEIATSHIDFSLLAPTQRIWYPVKCNWKIYIDNYLEGYHIPHVHPELNKLIDYRDYTTTVFDGYSLQQAHFKEDENQYGSASDEAFYYFLFPNIMLNILPDRVQVNRVLPNGPENCRVLFDYFHNAQTYDGKAVENDLAYSESVQKEDEEICEAVQKRMHSRGYERGRFSPKTEIGVYHFQKELLTALGEGKI